MKLTNYGLPGFADLDELGDLIEHLESGIDGQELVLALNDDRGVFHGLGCEFINVHGIPPEAEPRFL